MRTLIAALSSLAFSASIAYAGGSDTNDQACGSVAAGKNAPNGAYIRNHSTTGPITAVISAVGESGTHSVLSNGPNGWSTHETMHAPGTQSWPSACSVPLRPNELQYGYPGASQINDGALYTFYYGGGGSQSWVYYQRGDGETNNNGMVRGDTVANWAWSTAPYTWVGSQKDGSQGLYRIGFTSGSWLNYSLFTYRTMASEQWAYADSNNGFVCSTLIDGLAYRAGQSTSQNGAVGAAIDSYTYSHAQIANAANALYNGVYNDCSNGMGFWDSVGSSLLCFDSDECDEAADQVTNCMAANQCGTSNNSYWHNVVNDGSSTGTVISPDRNTGWGVHPYGHNVNGPWTWDGNQMLYWNTGGNTYGCWF